MTTEQHTRAAPGRAVLARDQITTGRVVEARDDKAGQRVYWARLLAYGESANGRVYPPQLMKTTVALYSGAQIFNRHRNAADFVSSTIEGLVGHVGAVQAGPDGLYGELVLLPGASHAAEVLDATITAQEAGLSPLVGISHDVIGEFRPVMQDGRTVQHAVKIVRVMSVDLVASAAAGGMAVGVVADGAADPSTGPGAQVAPGWDWGELAALHDSATMRGRQVIAEETVARGLPSTVAGEVANALPTLFSQSQLTGVLRAVQEAHSHAERAALAPDAGRVHVAEESRDKKIKALDAMLDSRGTGPAYRTIKEAWLDWTGTSVRFLDGDLNRRILAECHGGGYDSAHLSESLVAASWAQVLGDSITRRLIAEYQQPSLQTWQQIVSAVSLGVDFRTQRRGRVGGYGILPTVNEGAPYQPLPSPPDEEASYQITKRGGTEDLTLEMIANDDLAAIRLIPVRLGRAAANSIFRFVFDMLGGNAPCSYDGTALFHTLHGNTDNPAILAQSTLSAARRKMRKQAAYGDPANTLSIIPKTLVVPPDLEEIAFQLTRSTVAIPATPAGPSDTPNLHATMDDPIVIDYWTDGNDWFLVGDPAVVATIEVGFYASTSDPELFIQSDPSAGSVFNADTITWKIRHAYSGTVLDHRAFYRGAN